MITPTDASGERTPPTEVGSVWSILCDFDNTLSLLDVTDTLLNRFGQSGWQELETLWIEGKIGSQACMAGQIELLDASREELDGCLAEISIDSGFIEFFDFTRSHQIPLTIVSDGLDYAIETILKANGIEHVSIIANHLKQVGERRWSLDFPYFQPDCLTASGTCKCAVARQKSPHPVLMIGDGRSDFCVAAQADFVLAKDALLEECRRLTLPHAAFRDFHEALIHLKILLQQPKPMSLRNPL